MTPAEWLYTKGDGLHKFMGEFHFTFAKDYAEYYHAQKSRWISVNEGLPDALTPVLVQFAGELDDPAVCHLNKKGEWLLSHNCLIIEALYAPVEWRPLEESPRITINTGNLPA